MLSSEFLKLVADINGDRALSETAAANAHRVEYCLYGEDSDYFSAAVYCDDFVLLFSNGWRHVDDVGRISEADAVLRTAHLRFPL